MDDFFNTNPINEPSATDPAPAQPTPTEPAQPSTDPIMGGTKQTPYNNPYNTPYNSPYNTPYNQTNQYTTNTQPNVYNQTASQYIKPKKPKNKTNIGKLVFAVLLCMCIVFSSVSIGLSLSDKKGSNNSFISKDNNDKTNDDGAKANVENSPSSFSEYSGKGSMTPEQVYNAVKDINVGILIYSQNQSVGGGSGIVVGADKNNKYTYIITAAHVISDSNINIQVQFSDESVVDAEIVGFDKKTDVGVVRVEKTGLKAATFGNSDKLTVGQTVYAIGNPFGTEFFGSFTSGMISAIDRPIQTTNSSYDLPCIQHDAAINSGNSGGALVNEFGQIIGLNNAKLSSNQDSIDGMGFAVPSNTMLETYNEIIKNGFVSRPALGIEYFRAADDNTYATVAWRNNLPFGSIVIASINEKSDIGNHGIKIGDVITAVNGKKLTSTDILLETIEEGKVGDEITLTIHRLNNDGSVNKSFNAKVKLIADTGSSTPTEQTTEPQVVPFDPFDPFSYFEGFGF